MARPVVRVIGEDRLRRSLRRAGHDLDEVKDAHRKAAAYVAGRARSAAPQVTGRLAGTVRGNNAVRRATVKAGGYGVVYAGPIHWGWPRRNITAQPFIADTAQATEPQWLRIYLDDIDSILGKVRGL